MRWGADARRQPPSRFLAASLNSIALAIDFHGPGRTALLLRRCRDVNPLDHGDPLDDDRRLHLHDLRHGAARARKPSRPLSTGGTLRTRRADRALRTSRTLSTATSATGRTDGTLGTCWPLMTGRTLWSCWALGTIRASRACFTCRTSRARRARYSALVEVGVSVGLAPVYTGVRRPGFALTDCRSSGHAHHAERESHSRKHKVHLVLHLFLLDRD